MSEFSIADFAESLILEDSKSKKPSLRHPSLPAMPTGGKDISHIEVTEKDMGDIMARSFGVPIVQKKESVVESKSTITPKKANKSPEELLKEFSEVLIKGKQLIVEMTSCGMLGTNMADPRPGKTVIGKKKKKKKVSLGWKF